MFQHRFRQCLSTAYRTSREGTTESRGSISKSIHPIHEKIWYNFCAQKNLKRFERKNSLPNSEDFPNVWWNSPEKKCKSTSTLRPPAPGLLEGSPQHAVDVAGWRKLRKIIWKWSKSAAVTENTPARDKNLEEYLIFHCTTTGTYPEMANRTDLDHRTGLLRLISQPCSIKIKAAARDGG